METKAWIKKRTQGRDFKSESRLVLKMILASFLAWTLCVLLGEEHPIFAALVPLVALNGDPFTSLNVSITRLIGIVVGVVVGVFLIKLGWASLLTVALGLVVTGALSIPLNISNRPNHQVMVSFLFMMGLDQTGAAGVGFSRVWETLAGAVIALTVAIYLWPPDPLRELRIQLSTLRTHVVEGFSNLALNIKQGEKPKLSEYREHSLQAIQRVLELEKFEQGLKLNPRRKQDAEAFYRVSERIHLAARMHRHLRAIARSVADNPGLWQREEYVVMFNLLARFSEKNLHGQTANFEALQTSIAMLSQKSLEEALLKSQLQRLLVDVDKGKQLTESIEVVQHLI